MAVRYNKKKLNKLKIINSKYEVEIQVIKVLKQDMDDGITA